MGLLVAVIVGVGNVFIVTVSVSIQPLTSVPVTLYVVVTVGLTVTGVPIKEPGIHVYDEAPIAESVEVFPGQTLGGAPIALIVGFEFTVIEIVFEFEHPLLVPVTVYMVLMVGLTATLDPVKAPGFHVYVIAPLAVKVADNPEQTAVEEDVAVIVGIGFTFRFIVELPVQPNEDVATTLYTVVIVGFTITLLVKAPPGFQV